jgi:hypothetical protein
MTAMQLTHPDFSQPQPSRSSAAAGQDSARIWPADQPPTVAAPFQRLDPGIVNEAIPAFFIGRNRQGFWVARDANGTIGGIFLFESSAVEFAKRSSHPLACATIYPSERFELDQENQGNPLVAALISLLRLVTRPGGRRAGIARR